MPVVGSFPCPSPCPFPCPSPCPLASHFASLPLPLFIIQYRLYTNNIQPRRPVLEFVSLQTPLVLKLYHLFYNFVENH